jgi:NAD(P)-dependent dehydrogenase (short-subunit alcohol dehydrogenase family)
MQAGLKDKVVVITGANSGIGLACAKAFVAEGAHVVGGDRSVSALADASGILPVELDLLASTGPQELIDRATKEFGAVDVLVNNLGGAQHR